MTDALTRLLSDHKYTQFDLQGDGEHEVCASCHEVVPGLHAAGCPVPEVRGRQFPGALTPERADRLTAVLAFRDRLDKHRAEPGSARLGIAIQNLKEAEARTQALYLVVRDLTHASFPDVQADPLVAALRDLLGLFDAERRAVEAEVRRFAEVKAREDAYARVRTEAGLPEFPFYLGELIADAAKETA